jgi:hypothetical protein
MPEYKEGRKEKQKKKKITAKLRGKTKQKNFMLSSNP